MPPHQQDKSSLRGHFRAARHEIGAAQRQRAERAINQAVEDYCAVRKPRRIAAYMAFDGEPDISPALAGLSGHGIEAYLPVITSHAASSELHFRRWSPATPDSKAGELQQNAFGIHEPVAGERCEAQELDVVFMPLVAWDRTGGRLGMGAGYYDRALAQVSNRGVPLRIGIAFEVQRARSVPMTSEDVRLHGVITEEGLFTFGD